MARMPRVNMVPRAIDTPASCSIGGRKGYQYVDTQTRPKGQQARTREPLPQQIIAAAYFLSPNKHNALIYSLSADDFRLVTT